MRISTNYGFKLPEGTDNVKRQDLVDNFESIDTNMKELAAQSSENTKYAQNGNKLYNSLYKMQDGLTTKGIAFGDSITWGQIPLVGGQSSVNYPTVLQSKLQKIYGNNNITIVNEGNPGQTTTFGLANIDTQVISQAPDFCIMMWGTNDCTSRLDLATFKDNIRQMVKRCLTANIEVLLLTCHCILKSDDSRTNRQQLYAKATIEIAKELDVAYINMFEEISNIINNNVKAPLVLLPDMVHFDQWLYPYLAYIIIDNALYINTLSQILEVNNGTIHIPVYHNPYIRTDIPLAGEYASTINMYGETLGMTVDGTLGTYLRFVFFNKKPNRNLVLISEKNTLGGQLTILDNGSSVGTIDFYSSVMSIQNVPNTIIENLSYGLHIIEILNTNIVKGQSSGTGKVYLAGFQIVENKNLNIGKYGGNTSFVSEVYKKIIDGQTKFTDSDATKNSQLVFNNSFVEAKSGKTLEIEIAGTFFTGSGITWFNNATDNGTLGSGYEVMLYGGYLNLYKSDGNTYNPINQVVTALDYSVARTFKITHTSAGVITIYIDGTQIMRYTDTSENSGYVGLYSGVSATGTMTITRCEYCYI